MSTIAEHSASKDPGPDGLLSKDRARSSTFNSSALYCASSELAFSSVAASSAADACGEDTAPHGDAAATGEVVLAAETCSGSAILPHVGRGADREGACYKQ